MIFRRIHTSTRNKKDIITWRGHEVTRIEAFSDAIFAFAITLLIVSLEVPKDFEELLENMRGFIPFSVSFIIFFQIWSAQNQFFRRYGMHDEPTLIINAMLLFVMLFFVYPMKFLWNALFLGKTFKLTEAEQLVKLFYIYSGGFAIIYMLLAAMYLHAFRRRQHLALTKSEIFETKTFIYRNFAISMVGLFSVLCASLHIMSLAGISYALIGPAVGMIHARRSKIYKAKFGDNFVERVVVREELAGEAIENDN